MAEDEVLRQALEELIEKPIPEGRYRVSFMAGPCPVCFTFDDERLRTYFDWKIALLRTEEAPSMTFYVAASHDIDEVLSAYDKTEYRCFEMESSSGKCEIQLFPDTEAVSNTVFIWNGEQRKGAALFTEDKTEYTIKMSMMMSPLLAMALASDRIALVHSAGVATEYGGAIITGFPCAGKTTLACACIQNGMGYLSDDTVYLSAENRMMYPVESTIHPDHDVIVMMDFRYGKRCVLDTDLDPIKRHADLTGLEELFVRSAEPVAVIMCRGFADEISLEKIPPMTPAVQMLMSSTKLLGAGNGYRAALSETRRLLTSLPAYGFTAGKDMEKNAECVYNIIKGAKR